MKTAGVDFASNNEKTALCVIAWSSQRAIVEELTVGVGDGEIVDCISEVKKLGIDVPLGWPTAFADAVGEYSKGSPWPPNYQHAKNEEYRLRLTDSYVKEAVGGNPPLSVSADRIAIPAMRAAALLSSLSSVSARDGSGKVVEVYPAAALRRWELDSRQYKTTKNLDRRHGLVNEILSKVPWLSLNEVQKKLVIENDDAFDSVVAALVARAAAKGLVDTIPKKCRKAALREGWIALPALGSLDHLVGK